MLKNFLIELVLKKIFINLNKQQVILLILIPLLFSCSQSKKINSKKYYKNSNGLNFIMKQFANNIENIWGFNEIKVIGPKDYIKYSNNYLTRSHIDFDKGIISIETINHNNPIYHLRNAITNILMINVESLYNKSKKIKEPLLYGQILDNKKKFILNKNDANKFANFLIKHKVEYRRNRLNVILYVTIPMVRNHLKKRIDKYLPIICKASKKYGVVKSLILAIIQIESSFNQYAISQNNAVGLMQIIPKTAGLDVFRKKGKWGKPTRNYLLNPRHNVDIGTAYLALLQNNYLSGIKNPISRLYATIIAYNSGPASVLKIFSKNKNFALKKINSMSPNKFYKYLTMYHPSIQSRNYLYKVYNAKLNFYKY